MSDFKGLTVRALRELARKHLGKGHSKLKTKQELFEALKKVVPELLKSLAPPPEPSGPKSKLGAAKQLPAKIIRFARKALPGGKVTAEAKPPSPPEPHLAEPLVEGFFVARVAGEEEVRRHHLTEEAQAVEPGANGHGFDEQLGELPPSYGGESAVLLPRDPGTLFFFWDFSAHAREEAARGLPDPRAVIRVYEGEELVREVDFALESRSYYLHGLQPGRAYRVEAHFVGSDGRSRRVGAASNAVALPSAGPSGDLTVRFMRIPWDMPLGRLKEAATGGQRPPAQRPAGEERLEPRRLALPTSPAWPLPWSTPGPGPNDSGWVPPRSGHPC